VTIRLRLTIWFVVTIVVLFSLVGGITWFQYSRMVHSTLNQELAARADDVRSSLEASPSGLPDTTEPAWLGIFAAVFTTNGDLAGASRDAPAGLAVPALGARTVYLGPGRVAYAIDAIAGPDGATIVAGRPLTQVEAGLTDLAGLMLLVGVVASAASLAGGWWLAGRALRPVDAMVREANRIGTDELDRRLPVPATDDEIGRLARTLNALLDRVAETVQRERRFVATASHDLRTPIASLQGELEIAAMHGTDRASLMRSIRAAHADTVRLAALASNLLRLAEAESSGRELLRRPVPVRDLLDGVVYRFSPLATARRVTIETTAPDVVADIDRVRLEQAVGNLLSNAILESSPGATVEVKVVIEQGGAPQGRTMVIDVLDRGPGVPARLRDRLFQPFAMEPAGRDDRTGLGLATAAAAAEAHAGKIGYRDRPGGGAWFQLSIPLGGQP
jgi:two-component system OmpR family sensor kinase